MSSVQPAGAGRVRVRLTGVERAHLTDLLTVLLDRLAGLAASPAADPLEQLAGTAAVPAPADPALARLFPVAYPEDAAAADEFRRFTQEELRTGKDQSARSVLAEIAGTDPTATLTLGPDRVECWLSTLNDLRLYLGTRLEVTEEDPVEVLERLDPDDPTAAALVSYYWLGELQEALLWALQRR